MYFFFRWEYVHEWGLGVRRKQVETNVGLCSRDPLCLMKTCRQQRYICLVFCDWYVVDFLIYVINEKYEEYILMQFFMLYLYVFIHRYTGLAKCILIGKKRTCFLLHCHVLIWTFFNPFAGWRCSWMQYIICSKRFAALMSSHHWGCFLVSKWCGPIFSKLYVLILP